MTFENLYYKRTAGTAKACFACRFKSTTTVLATLKTEDYFYVCPIHLSDNGFATIVVSDSKPVVSPEEIARVKAEWEEKQKQKAEKQKEEKEKGKEKEEDKETEKETSKDKDKSKVANPSASKAELSISSSPSPTQKHERYILHRDIFKMRQDIHKKRKQIAQAKELAPRLPGAPRGNV